MAKLDLNKFTKTKLVAKLYTLQSNWSRQPSEITLNKEKALDYTKKVLNDNFIFPKSKEESLTMNLVLFFMGNEKNIFSKAIK
jgi:hypothetical protein